MRRRLLLVEDDQSSRRALEKILARQGWEVSAASSLAKARRLIESTPDVLILDLMLPDGDGSSLLRLIRDQNWPVRVVVTTGSSESARLASVNHLKPDSFLMKPVDLDQLLKAVGPVG